MQTQQTIRIASSRTLLRRFGSSMRHQHRQRLLAQEVEAHAAEQALVEARVAEGAGHDEIGVLGVEARKQRLDRGQVPGIRPVRDMLGLDAVRRQVIGELLS